MRKPRPRRPERAPSSPDKRLLVAGISIALMLAYGGTFTAAASGSGYNFVPSFDGFFWTMVSLMIASFSVTVVGGLA